MYRIGTVTTCAAVLVCITFSTASAVTCDERIAGSCPVEPIVEQADANAEPASVTPLAYARAGKERGVRRVRRASRYSRRVERRRPAKAVQIARAEQQAPRPQQEIIEPDTAQAAATILPTVAAILPPTFVRDANIDGARLEAGWNAVAPPQTVNAAKPAASVETAGQATADTPVLVQVADNATEAGQQRTEFIQAAAASLLGPADETPWLRFAVLAFGGLLAFGSAIRLFV